MLHLFIKRPFRKELAQAESRSKIVYNTLHRIQIDVKFLSFKDPSGTLKKMHQYTAIDDATGARALKIYPKHNQESAIEFGNYVRERLPFRIHTIQTDNGHEFQAKFQRSAVHIFEVDLNCWKNGTDRAVQFWDSCLTGVNSSPSVAANTKVHLINSSKQRTIFPNSPLLKDNRSGDLLNDLIDKGPRMKELFECGLVPDNKVKIVLLY